MSASGLPPSDDISRKEMLKLMGDRMTEMENRLREESRKENEALRRRTELLEAMVLPDHRYKDLGGDTFFYMKLKRLVKVLEKQCDGDETKLAELHAWEKATNKKANRRIIACAGAAALTGLAVGGIVIGGSHLCAGSTVMIAGLATTIVGVTALPAVGIAVAAVAGALLIFGLGYGIAHLVRQKKAKKVVAVSLQVDQDGTQPLLLSRQSDAIPVSISAGQV